MDEARRIIEEYAEDLREVIKQLRRKMNEDASMPREIAITLWSLAAACVMAFGMAALVAFH